MRVAAGDARRFERFEAEGGSCPACNRRVELWTCSECGTSSWVIDCEHRVAPFGLRRGRADGTARARCFCFGCAQVLPERRAASGGGSAC
jgi:hypothetical protein